MRINNNLMAINTHRQLGITNTKVQNQWKSYHQGLELTVLVMTLQVLQFLKK